MKSTVRSRRSTFVTITAAALIASAGFLYAGPLNPPAGPVTSTFKTTQEVYDKAAAAEPRTAISAANTPGDSNSVFKITQPGSYYLTGNVTGVAGKHGIEIATNNVSIDLNNFAVLGTVTSLNGITVSGARNSLSVRNGTVTGWGGSGVQLDSGGLGSIVESVIAQANVNWGIIAGQGGIIRGCSASQNGHNTTDSGGISTGLGGLVESCTANSNNGDGIDCLSSGTVRACSVTDSVHVGIYIGGNGFVRDCTISENAIGVYAFTHATVSNCSVTNSTSAAIQASNGCRILNNTCWNTIAPEPFRWGINASGPGSRIEGNHCMGFDVGFHSSSTSGIYLRNTAQSNTTNWSIIAGNACYVVSATTGPAINGNNGGFGLGTTDPNANFTY